MKPRSYWLAGLMAIALLPGAPKARADNGEVSATLTYRSFASFDETLRYLGSYSGYGMDRSASIPSAYQTPKEVDKTQFFQLYLPMERRAIPALLGKTPSSAVNWDRLWIDFDGNKQFSRAEMYKGHADKQWLAFGPVTYKGQSKASGSFNLMFYNEPGADFSYYVLLPAGIRLGEVTFGGKKVQVGVIDSSANGVYGDVSGSYGENDTLAIDFAGQGFTRPANQDIFDMYAARKAVPMPRVVQAPDGAWYSVTVKPDGSRITLSPYKGALGQIRMGSAKTFIDLGGSNGPIKAVAPSGTVSVPAGTYNVSNIVLSSGEGSGAWCASLYYSGAKVPSLTVAEDKPVDLKIGPPFKPELTTTKNGAAVQFSLSLSDCAGYRVGSIQPSSGERPKPTLEIKQGDKVIHTAKFEFG